MMKTKLIMGAILTLFVIHTGIAQNCQSDTLFSDNIFLIDNSQSIDENEFGQFEQIILKSINDLQQKCPRGRVAVIHYGGPHGNNMVIEYNLSSNLQISAINRQFCPNNCFSEGDDLNAAIGNIIEAINNGNLQLNNDLSNLIIMTDAINAEDDCSVPSCSSTLPFTNIELLKNNYNFDVTVVGISALANASTLAVYASLGGDYYRSQLHEACQATADGCTMPRKYVPISFNSSAQSAAEKILSFVECQPIIIPQLNASLNSTNDQLCYDLNEMATLSLQIVSGTPPYQINWSHGLGNNYSTVVAPSMTTTYSVTITDGNGCSQTLTKTIIVDQQCIDPCVTQQNFLMVTGTQSLCMNNNESTTLTANMFGASGQVAYTWNVQDPLGQSQLVSSSYQTTVSPHQSTTYNVQGTDQNGCIASTQFFVQVLNCEDCQVSAGDPGDHLEHCLPKQGNVTINSPINTGLIVPENYEVIYILTNEDLKIVSYAVGSNVFQFDQPGIYRIHTLVAEVTDKSSVNYFDLSDIKPGISTLFLISSCIADHGVCADFDMRGKVHLVREYGHVDCQPVENSISLCSDGLDNDGDGLVDCRDSDCQKLTVCNESTLVNCNDLFDNDYDGLIDCYDPDCWQFTKCYEKEEKCSDGIDNDGDGLVDCADSSCNTTSYCKEESPSSCLDGLDNDGDGLIDCQDASCKKYVICAEYSAEACSDGIDNDLDGLVDCMDMGCREVAPTLCPSAEGTISMCSDGIDNDSDGLVDCADPDCGFTSLQNLQQELYKMIVTTPATCPRNSDGMITLTDKAVNVAYRYSLNNGTPQNSPTFSNVAAGVHTLTISTAAQCILTTTVSVAGELCPEICNDGIDNDGDGFTDCDDLDCNVNEIIGNIQVTNPSCRSAQDGTIRIMGQNTTEYYIYSLDGGNNYQTGSVFTSLGIGNYVVTVKKLEGCSYNYELTLSSDQDCPNQTENVTLNVRVNLQGAYDSDESTMTTTLNEMGYLPGQKATTYFGVNTPAGQPYQSEPWNYSGTEGMTSQAKGWKISKSNSYIDYDEDVVDWILVSLREDMSPKTIAWQGAALLYRDGQVVLINDIDIDRSKKYYVVIEHRNHLPVMSPTALTIRDGKISFDFTSQNSYYDLIGEGQTLMDDGSYAMMAGNGELISERSSPIDINSRDFYVWFQKIGANSSYYIEDYDLNGDVNVKDRIIWENNNGRFSATPYNRN